MVSIDLVNERLAERLESLLPELIGGTSTKAEWIGAPTRAGGLGDSLIVALKGSKRGRWFHHAAGVGGDPLGLINYARFNNNDMKAALRWARDFLGGELAPETDAQARARADRRAEQQRVERREEERQRARLRHQFFGLALEDWNATPVWHYLNNRLAGYLPRLGRLPRSIRYMPALYNAQLDRDFPAMVAAVVNIQGELTALHRTWLIRRGARDHTWDRLRAGDAEQFGGTRDGSELKGKKVLGAWKGCSIRIWPGERNGQRGRRWSELAPGERITLAEGIETSLTIALLEPATRVVCVISSEGFASVALPQAIDYVTIAADRDPGNKGTAIAIERARKAIAESGRAGEIKWPPVPYDDFNTMLREVVRHVATG